jgi:hypothetical protein
MIKVDTLLKVFIGEVVECIKRPCDVDKYAMAYNEPKTFEVRVATQVGGAYWSLRAVSSQLSYTESSEFENRANEFFHTHCRNIMDAYEGLDTPEYQD